MTDAITGRLENWYVEDLGGGTCQLHGNIFDDTKGRFYNGEPIITSRFHSRKCKRKEGDVVETLFSAYLLGKPMRAPDNKESK